MLVVLEISKPIQWKPFIGKTENEIFIGWLWFALIINKYDWYTIVTTKFRWQE